MTVFSLGSRLIQSEMTNAYEICIFTQGHVPVHLSNHLIHFLTPQPFILSGDLSTCALSFLTRLLFLCQDHRPQ